jgi:hypothetical protein
VMNGRMNEEIMILKVFKWVKNMTRL